MTKLGFIILFPVEEMRNMRAHVDITVEAGREIEARYQSEVCLGEGEVEESQKCWTLVSGICHYFLFFVEQNIWI